METIKRIGGLIRPYKRKIVFALMLQLVSILNRLITPYVTKTVVNDVITQMNMDLLLPLCGVLLGLTLIRGLCFFGRTQTFERISQNAVWDLRTGLYAHLEELPNQFYDKHRVGEIMSRMTGDIEGLRNLFANGIVTIFDNALLFVGALIFMMTMSWQVTLMILVMTPIIAVMAWAFNKKIRPAFREIREQKLFLIQGGNTVIELYLEDGSSVSLQSSMDGIYLFLDTAFAGWCLQKGIDPKDCTFHDPSKSWWFPHEEEI